MARGQQKIQSQQKNAEKQAKIKKQQAGGQKDSALASLKYSCAVCKAQMPDTKTYKQHFDNKHAGKDLPAELKEVV